MKNIKFLKYIIALLIFIWLFVIVDFKQLYQAFSHLTWGIIFYLLLISVLLIYISSIKWSIFLETSGKRIPAIKLFNLYLIGYFVNLLMPSFIGGDAVRSYYAGKKTSQENAFAATFLERYTGFVSMLILGLLGLLCVDYVATNILLTLLLITLVLILGTIFVLNSISLKFLAAIPFVKKYSKHFKEIQAILWDAFKSKQLIIKTMSLSFLFHCFTVVNTVAAAYAVGWYEVPFFDLFVVLPIILLIAAIPITPSGLGLQEGAFYYYLTLLGASPAEALGVALILRAKMYILALLGGLIFLKQKN